MIQKPEFEISQANLIQSIEKIKPQQPKKSIRLKLNLKEELKSLEVYEDTLYIGTSESKVLLYQLYQNQSEEQLLTLQYITKIYPHCSSVQSIVAVERFLVIIPYEEQQLVRIWDRATLKLMHGYKGHEKQISKVMFLKNGNYIVSISHDATARIWNVEQHDEFEKEIIKYQGSYPLLAIEQIDQSTLALGGDSCFITLWDWKKQETRCKAFGHPGSVLCLSYYQPYLVSSGGDSKLKIWQIQEAMNSFSQINTKKMVERQECERVPMLELLLQKEVKGQLARNQFFFKLDNYRILIVDSTGHIFSINSKLEVKTENISIEYFRRILSVKIWKEYFLYLPSYEKKEKKFLNIYKPNQPDFKEEQASGFTLTTALQLFTNLLEVKGSEEDPAEAS